MTAVPGKDRKLLSVSIAAGPAITEFLDTIDSAKTGLLTSTRTETSKDLAVFRLPTESNPDQIVNEIRAIADKRSMDHLIIECEPDRPPMAYASLFAAADHLPQTLSEISQLTVTLFVIQPADFLNAILGRGKNSLPACFVAEQIEFVSHIFLDAASDDHDFELARSIALALNPRAEVSPLISARMIMRNLSAASLDFEEALAGAGWRQLLDAPAPTSTTDERITALAYQARRPFHPGRFWDLLQKKLGGVFRAKGFFWLATRMDEVGGLNLAGLELHCASAGSWWATRDQGSREAEMPERTRNEWKEPFGDRRQAFAIMALGLDRNTLQSQLDACSLTDEEMAEGPESWNNFADPFPSWSNHAHDHHHDHNHGCEHHHDSEDHDCCHH
jgi:G3E family GTPase